MARSQETRNKKEVRTKKEKSRKDKEKKRLERKQNSRDGNDLDAMIAYVDEFGNITSTPPDPLQRKKVNPEEINISGYKTREPEEEQAGRTGIVTFFNDSKGFGFIEDTVTRERIFVHVHGLLEPIKENNKVSFEVEKGMKGLTAVNVKIVRE